jgi:transcriptional/translational regulatory protein YebC/TACO1
MVEVMSDNKNRTAQEIKNVFERGGGSLAGPNAVAFNFQSKGYMLVKKLADPDSQMLSLIDAGAEDITDTEDGFEVYVAPDKLSQIHKQLSEKGFEVTQTELQMKPVNFQVVDNPAQAAKALKFLEEIENLDDVQKVFSNLDIPDEIVKEIPV